MSAARCLISQGDRISPDDWSNKCVRFSPAEHYFNQVNNAVGSKLKCPVFVAHDMSASWLMDRRRRGCGKVGIPRLLRDSQAQWKTWFWFSTERLLHSLSQAIRFVLPQPRPSLRVVTAHHMRPVPNTPALVQMFTDRHRASGQSSSPARRFDLQNLSSHYDRVIPAHHACLLHREHHLQILSPAGHKRAALLRRRDLKPLIELGHVFLPQKNVGFLQRADPAQAQFLGQASLPSSKPPFRTPPRLRRVSRNHANPQLLQRASHLRQPSRIHFPARPWGPKEVTGAVAVQGAENPLLLDHLPQPPQH